MNQLEVDQLGMAFVSYKKNLIGRTPIRSVEALKNVNFAIDSHEFVSIVGPSGCGKTTLLRIVAGLEKNTTGTVVMRGGGRGNPGAKTSMVFQSIGLYPWLTIEQNVLLAVEFGAKRRLRQEERERALQCLRLVVLEDFRSFYPHQLSGGMQQRVGLARALATQPTLLLMDEPFGALDAQTRSVMQDELLGLYDNLDQSVLFITHDIDEAVYLSDRVLVMSGRPGTISLEVKIDLPRPRLESHRNSPEFGEFRQSVWSALRTEASLASRGVVQ